MNKRIYIIIYLIIFLFAFDILYAESEWELVLEEDDIKVYSRPIEDSGLKEFKGLTIMNSNARVIREAMNDTANYIKWMLNCIEARELKIIDDLNSIKYTKTESPWPAQDRDVVFTEKTVIDPESGIITTDVNAVKEPLVPVSEDLVRLTDMKCRFIYEPISKNKSKVTCFLRIDPGGNIPKFLVNILMKRWPYKALNETRILAKNEKYIKAAAAVENK